MAKDRRFHRLPFFVPDESAMPRTKECHSPKLFMKFYWILIWIQSFPFIQNRQIIPGQDLQMCLIMVVCQDLRSRDEVRVDLKGKVRSQPGSDRCNWRR